MKKSFVVIVACLVLVAAVLVLVLTKNLGGTSPLTPATPSADGKEQAVPDTAMRSMFSWDGEALASDARADLLSVALSLKLTDWYQEFSDSELYDEQTQELLHQLHNMGINGYYLAGDASWGLDPTASEMLRVVDRVAAYNSSHTDGEQLRGIVFDVEPYLTDEWDEDPDKVMQSYLQAAAATYRSAQTHELRMVLCIPYWYDSKGYTEQLEQLISKSCDAIAVMNYNRSGELKAIRDEVSLAKKHDKAVECIFEFQEAGKHSLTQNETYHQLGLDAALQSFTELAGELDYNKLSFSYHYYNPILEMYKK